MDTRPAVGNRWLADGGNRYRTPGLYYEEEFESVDRLVGEGPVAAFVGFSPTDRVDEGVAPLHFTRWAQFEARFSGSTGTGYLGDAVRGFFENGGRRCVVVPVRATGAPAELVAALKAPFDPDGLIEGLGNVDLVCVPDAMNDALAGSETAVLEIQAAALEHCARLRDRFAILDSLPAARSHAVDDARGVAQVADQWSALPPRNGALYFPWLRIRADAGPDQTRLVPPCGHVAGVYARVDVQTGVHKAPANEMLEGVVDVAAHVGDDEQAGLNERGVNCLRSFPGRGIRVWGARTLSGEPAWCFVNVSRLFATLTNRLQQGFDDLVFEGNDALLWANLRDRLTALCLALFDGGALQGRTADEAFFVKCDAETNPLESRDAGDVVARIGLAVLAPLEFIVVHVTRRASGATLAQPSTP